MMITDIVIMFMNELHINPHSGNNLTGVKPELCEGTTCDIAIA